MKTIKLEIESELLDELNRETGAARTWHVNRAIRLYLDMQLMRRQIKFMMEQDTIDVVVRSWIAKNIPEAARVNVTTK